MSHGLKDVHKVIIFPSELISGFETILIRSDHLHFRCLDFFISNDSSQLFSSLFLYLSSFEVQ